MHVPPPLARAWTAARPETLERAGGAADGVHGHLTFAPARVQWDALHDEDTAVRAALTAVFQDGLVVIEGLPAHDEGAWANATRSTFQRLMPERLRSSISEDAF